MGRENLRSRRGDQLGDCVTSGQEMSVAWTRVELWKQRRAMVSGRILAAELTGPAGLGVRLRIYKESRLAAGDGD